MDRDKNLTIKFNKITDDKNLETKLKNKIILVHLANNTKTIDLN